MRHLPAADGACLDCHDPHTSDHQPLLASAEDQLCTTCHSDIEDILARAGPLAIIDPDPGAARGIAVSDADTENGSWQYSIDNGTTWSFLSISSFGGVPRVHLLAA